MKQLLSLLSLMLFVAVGTPTYAQDDKPSSDEIWYTTTDGNIVKPSSGALGSKILSNTYRNGKGVIIVEGDSIVEIGKGAFSGCRNLNTITIPDSVTSIGEGAFYGCQNLSGFAGKFATADGRCLIANGKLIAFAPSGLTRYSIPDSVTSIGDSAFSGCDSLTSVIIGNSVTSIGDWAFWDCSSLTSITIPDSVTSIRDYAFYGCTSLTSVTMGNGVTSIGFCAFYGCTSLTSITIPDRVTSIRSGAFDDCTSLTSVTMGNGVTSIGKKAFSGCIKLERVYLSSLIPPTLRENAFSGNAQNLLIYIPKEAYKSYLSMDCWKPYSNLLERYQPEDAQVSATSTAREIWYTTTDGNIVKPNLGAFDPKIHSNTYRNGKGVIIVEGDYIEKIGEEAFWDCTSLTSITIPDSVTDIREGVFNGCSSLKEFKGKFASEDGRCLVVDGKLVAFAPLGLTQYSIPDSVTSIGWYTFAGCSSLTSITIPDSVTSIEWEVFSGCRSLTNVTMGNGVTSIGSYAFIGCPSLTSITIPDSVTEIGDCTFGHCTSLTSVTMGNGVASIGDDAFRGCSSLTSITITDSVTSIGKGAFWGCTSLKEVYCKPTTPPSGYSGMFDGNASGRKIYVPRGSVNTYKNAKNWSDYADAIVGYDF